MKSKLHTISIGQSTHEDLDRNSGLRRILFDQSCLQRILSRKKSGLWRIFIYFFCLNRDAFDLKILVLSTNSLVVKMIPTPILSDHNDIIRTKQ